MSRIVISWAGLPQYAARLLKAFLRDIEEEVVIIGTPPSVPVEGMEKALGQKILWIANDVKKITWEELGLTVPEIFIQSGWWVQPFFRLASEVKKKGGKVIGLADNNFRGDIKQLLGVIKFRLSLRNHFDAMMVPGQEGVRLMKYFGMPEDRIRTGMYGADPDLFFSIVPLTRRPKTFLYAGQFIKRKRIQDLCNAFLRLKAQYPEWSLLLCGNGVLRSKIPDSPGIIVREFVQPEQIAEIYRSSRFFILPSVQENWGLVVHEAALSGCALLLSSAVGSAADLASGENSLIFKCNDENSIFEALKSAVQWDEFQYESASRSSIEQSRKFGPDIFSRSLKELIEIVSQK
jgi:glycosyltransferase involved in cell wall biosynthesis